MKTVKITLLSLVVMCALPLASWAQNWSLVIRDASLNTPTNQVNGITGNSAILYATLFNFTGTLASDDGTGNPALATTLDFAGFGFTLNPGQNDLDSRFTSDPLIPGWPQVVGSSDGTTPGTSGYVALGRFDLTGLAPGIYTEDFTTGAYTDDINSSVVFGDIQGTLTLDIKPAVSTPEPSVFVLFASAFFTTAFGTVFKAWSSRRKQTYVRGQ